MDVHNSQPRSLIEIRIEDERSTSIAVRLFLYPSEHEQFAREVAQVWDQQWGGRPSKIFINGEPYTLSEPEEKKP